MSALPAHDRLLRRYSLRGELVTETALHVGTGEAGAATGTDMPVARDGHGRPYLPGSSFRGALRSGLESLLRGLGPAAPRVCDLFETAETHPDRSCAERVKARREERKRAGTEELTEDGAFALAAEESCEICRLFGQLFLASRVRVADLPLLSEPDEAPTSLRDGVGLDRDLRTAAKGILYNFEAVSPGARFQLRIDAENLEPWEMGLLVIGLDLFVAGFARLGGKSSRGLGLVTFAELAVTCRTAADFFQGTTGTAPALDDLRQAARAHYLPEETS